MPAAKSLRPVKQKRALLESNPPRDNWIERRRNKKRLRIRGGQNLPKWKKEAFISEPEHALKTHRPRSGKAPNGQPKNNGKKYLSFFSHAAFHAEPVQSVHAHGGLHSLPAPPCRCAKQIVVYLQVH